MVLDADWSIQCSIHTAKQERLRIAKHRKAQCYRKRSLGIFQEWINQPFQPNNV